MVGRRITRPSWLRPGARASRRIACARWPGPGPRDPAEEQALDSEMKAVSAQVSKVQEELEGPGHERARARPTCKAVAEQRKVYSALAHRALQAQGRAGVDRRIQGGRRPAKLVPELNKYLAPSRTWCAYQDALFQAANARIDAVYADSRKFLIWPWACLPWRAALALGLWLTRSITRPLAHAVGLARQVASGDLTADIQVTSTR